MTRRCSAHALFGSSDPASSAVFSSLFISSSLNWLFSAVSKDAQAPPAVKDQAKTEKPDWAKRERRRIHRPFSQLMGAHSDFYDNKTRKNIFCDLPVVFKVMMREFVTFSTVSNPAAASVASFTESSTWDNTSVKSNKHLDNHQNKIIWRVFCSGPGTCSFVFPNFYARLQWKLVKP